MASFVDDPKSILSTFTPYVDDLQTDVLTRVELEKQRQYDLGFQQVQGQFTSIAGLPIAKKETQQYVQQKLSQLKQSLSSSITGDFSDGRLLNQIGGYTSRIEKDPIVQNGVQSTVRAQKAFQEMEAAKKEGKWSPANETDFTDTYGAWMNDGRADTVLEKEYTPFKDVRKKVLDIVKEVGEDVNSSEFPFIIGQNGKVTFNDVMTSKKVSGKSRQKILEALNAGLDEGDINQLAIEGRYNYRGMSPEQLATVHRTNTESNLELLKNKRSALQLKLASTPNDKDLQDQVADIDEQQQGIVKQYNKELEFLQQNPDGFKANLYTRNFLLHSSIAFSSSKEELSYKVSPYFEVWKDKESLRKQAAELTLDLQKFEYQKEHDKDLLALEQQKLAGKKKPGGEDSSYSGVVNSPSLPGDEGTATENSFLEQTNALSASVNAARQAVVTNPSYEQYFAGKSPDEQGVAYEHLKGDWKAGRLQDPDLISHFSNTAKVEQQMDNYNAKLAEIQKKAKELFPDSHPNTVSSQNQQLAGNAPALGGGLSTKAPKKVLTTVETPEQVKRKEYVNGELAKLNATIQTKTLWLKSDKAEDRAYSSAVVRKVLDYAKRFNISTKDAEALLEKNEFLQVGIDHKDASLGSPERTSLEIYNSDKSKRISIPFNSRQDALNVLGEGQDIFGDPLHDIKVQQSLGGGSTNTQRGGKTTAYLQPSDFGQSVKYGITGDLEQSASSNGSQKLKLYITDKKSGKEFTLYYPGLITEEDLRTGFLQKYIHDLTIDKVIELNEKNKAKN